MKHAAFDDPMGPAHGIVQMVRLLVCLLLLPIGASAQTPGRASFVVFEKGQRVGMLETHVTRATDGWRVQSSMQTKGAVPITIVNLDLQYDARWSSRWMTMEMKSPDNVIVHVAVGRTTAHTDVVFPKEARFRSSSASANTIVRPDRAYGAYEAVAARLASGASGGDLPLFVPPIGETRAVVESVAAERIETTGGAVTAQHYVLTEIHTRPMRVDVWTDRGRLLRVDFPAAMISVVRSDVER